LRNAEDGVNSITQMSW